LTIAIVVYDTPVAEFARTLRGLKGALERVTVGYRLFLIFNGPSAGYADAIAESGLDPVIREGQGNIGFGRGHNLVLDEVGTVHLILNPDVVCQPDALRAGLAFLADNPECALVSPFAVWPDGSRQYLCKRYPSLVVLMVRFLAPGWARHPFKRLLDDYEMRDIDEQTVTWDPPIVSGCFMMVRGDALRAVGGFDPRFFLYFEDFDLSLRIRTQGRLAYVPHVVIEHAGGHAGRKGFWHVRQFVISSVRFFGTHGLRLW